MNIEEKEQKEKLNIQEGEGKEVEVVVCNGNEKAPGNTSFCVCGCVRESVCVCE